MEELAAIESGVTVLDVARKISFSKSTTHRVLQVLESENYAEKDPLSGRYRRGPQILDLAFRFISNFDLRSLAHPIIQNIVDQVNETTYLCFYTQQHLFFIDMVECSHAIRYINPLGRRPYMHAGAAGKVILAYLSANHLNQIISRGLPAFTVNTITDAEELKTELKKIRKDGYAFSNSEFAEGGVAFAGPILGSENRVIGCINIVIPADRFNKKKKDRFKTLVKDGAAKVSQLLIKSRVLNPVVI